MDLLTQIILGILGVAYVGIGIPLWGDFYRKIMKPWLRKLYYHFEKGQVHITNHIKGLNSYEYGNITKAER